MKKSSFSSRAEKYGDGFFESIRIRKGCAPLLDQHLQRIENGFNLLGFKDSKGAVQKVNSAIGKSELKEARLRISFCRSGNGHYLPNSDDVEYSMAFAALNPAAMPRKALEMAVFDGIKNIFSTISPLKTLSALKYVQAAKFAAAAKVDDVIMLDHQHHISETSNSNIFLFKDDRWFTPSLKSGCVAGVYRSALISALSVENIPLTARKIPLRELESFQSVFVCNAISGIRLVKSIKATNFDLEEAKKIRKIARTKIGF